MPGMSGELGASTQECGGVGNEIRYRKRQRACEVVPRCYLVVEHHRARLLQGTSVVIGAATAANGSSKDSVV